MNKLEEHKEKLANKIVNLYGYRGFREGFDTAIALDLPVKFFKWYQSMNKMGSEIRKKAVLSIRSTTYPSIEDFYKYWIDNIYKPE